VFNFDPNLSKLVTGKLELEIQPDSPAEDKHQESAGKFQGTWHCVSAGSNRAQLAKEELASLALQLTISGDEVTVSYNDNELHRHQMAGKLVIDRSKSPHFQVDFRSSGIDASARLTVQPFRRDVPASQTTLRMTRPGATFLVHRTFEADPSVFQFKRQESDSAQGEGSDIPDQIRSLGLVFSKEKNASLGTRHPIRVAGKDGEVLVYAGETKLIELPKATLSMQWKHDEESNPKALEDSKPFDFVLIDWKADGRVTWTCYRSAGLCEAAVIPESLSGSWELVSTLQPQVNGDVPVSDKKVFTFSDGRFSVEHNGKKEGAGTLLVDVSASPARLLAEYRDESGGLTGGQIDASFEIQSNGELWLAVADTSVRTKEAALARPRILWKLKRAQLGPVPEEITTGPSWP
jgi:hypothetical protein